MVFSHPKVAGNPTLLLASQERMGVLSYSCHTSPRTRCQCVAYDQTIDSEPTDECRGRHSGTSVPFGEKPSGADVLFCYPAPGADRHSTRPVLRY